MTRKKNKTAEELYDAFLADVLKSVPETKRAKFEEVLKDEDFATQTRDKVLARADYSRAMDALTDRETQFEQEVAEARTRIDGWVNWYEGVSQETATMKQRIEQYEHQFGRLDDDVKQTLRDQNNQRYLTAEDFNTALNSALQERDASAIAVADILTDLKIQHRQDFGERLDTKSLIDFATKRSLTLDVAYDYMIADRREEKRKADFDAQIKAAREEGAKEALSRHNLPVVPGNSVALPIDMAPKVPQGAMGAQDRVRSAVAEWNNSNHS